MITVRLEKQQVRALAQYLRGVLEDFPSIPGPAAPAPLVEPTVAEWTVGQIAVAVDEADAEVVIVIEELIATEQDELPEPDSGFLDLEGEDAAKIRAHVGVELAARFIATSDDLMNKGRPPCRLCGQPLDPSGHACPRLN